MRSSRLQTRLSRLERRQTTASAPKPPALTPETANAIRIELLGDIAEAPEGYVPTFTPAQRAAFIERALHDERTERNA